MGKINIENVIITPLDKINNPKGAILHGLKKSDDGFSGFGEAYFSTINNGEIKGWNRHKKMTLNLIVPFGSVTFVIFDNREDSSSSGNYVSVNLSSSNYKRLTIPPRLWLAFKGVNRGENLILNIADMEHDSKEIEKLDLNQFDYDWDNI